MSPAILTETVWALAHGAEPILPTRIIAVTTTEGRVQLERLFVRTPDLAGRSPWEALREALIAEGHDLTGRLRFGTTGDDIRVMTCADAATGATRELADIRSPEDNDAAASFLLEQVRGLVANPDLLVVGSLAGGRKTMGALLYACFTLAARETDRLTHVLVNPPYETLPGFWFPAQPGPSLRGRAGEERPAARAVVELADVPFVPISNLFQRELGRAPGGFERLVDQCRTEVRQRSSEHLQVTVDVRLPRLDLNGQAVELAPREHLLFLFLAHRCKHGGDPILSYRDALEPLNAFRMEMRRQADPSDFNDARHGDTFVRAFEEDLEIRRALSSLKRKLMGMGTNGARLAALLPGRSRFLLDLPGAQVRIR
jgi:CRISPR-associated protein (TIGR02584 family)